MRPGSSGDHPEPDFALADGFRDAMSLLAGTVAVITAGGGDQRRGLTATAVCSVAVQPPTMLVCVNRYGEAHKAIAESKNYCVNLLSEVARPYPVVGDWDRLAVVDPAGKLVIPLQTYGFTENVMTDANDAPLVDRAARKQFMAARQAQTVQVLRELKRFSK